MNFSGSLAEINQALDVWCSRSASSSDVILTITTNDQGHLGAGGPQQTSTDLTISITSGPATFTVTTSDDHDDGIWLILTDSCAKRSMQPMRTLARYNRLQHPWHVATHHFAQLFSPCPTSSIRLSLMAQPNRAQLHELAADMENRISRTRYG